MEHPRLGWVGIESKWSQLNPNFLPSRAPTNLPYRFSWHIKLFIPKITKIKYILNASLSVRIQFLCLWFNWYHNHFFPYLKEREHFFLQKVSLSNRIIFHCLLLNWNLHINYLVFPPCSLITIEYSNSYRETKHIS